MGGKTQKKGWQSFMAGSCAGACEVLATMPLDVAKTTMKVGTVKYATPIHALHSVYALGGVRAMYAGMPAFLSQTALKAAIRFTAFDSVKVRF
jgi:solute carrier family 25 citrate transporter 1